MPPETATDAPAAGDERVPGAGPDGKVARRHASCVAIDDAGVLLLGASGAGKSDLALRLIDRGAELVADDQVVIERRGDALIARAPATLRGLIEVRGLGILRLPSRGSARLSLAVELSPGGGGERLPGRRSYPLLGLRLKLVRLDAFAGSTPAALRLALRAERVA